MVLVVCKGKQVIYVLLAVKSSQRTVVQVYWCTVTSPALHTFELTLNDHITQRTCSRPLMTLSDGFSDPPSIPHRQALINKASGFHNPNAKGFHPRRNLVVAKVSNFRFLGPLKLRKAKKHIKETHMSVIENRTGRVWPTYVQKLTMAITTASVAEALRCRMCGCPQTVDRSSFGELPRAVTDLRSFLVDRTF